MDTTISAQNRPVEKGQKYILLDWLTQGKKITVPIAARQLLIGSLPRRILDLIEMGYPVNKRDIKYLRQDGITTRIREYYMPEEYIEKREEYLQALVERLAHRGVSVPDHSTPIE